MESPAGLGGVSEGARGWGARLARLGILRPVTLRMLFLSFVVFGLLATQRIPLELLPSGFSPPFLFIQVPTLVASPSDVEERIGLPVERELATVRGVVRVATRLRTNNASFFVELSDGTDMDLAWNQVQERLDRALRGVQGEIGRPFVWKYNPADDPVLWMAVTLPEHVADPSTLLRREVLPRLERVRGVSRVELFGAEDTEVVVRTSERRLQAVGLGMPGLIERLQRDNFALASGAVVAEDSRLPVRLAGRWESIDELRALPLGRGLGLGDVAEVAFARRAEQGLYRVNGRPAIIMAVYRESTANAVEVAAAVGRVVQDDLRQDDQLSDLRFPVFFDQGDVILEALGNLQETAIWGGLFAMVVLGFFFRRARPTLVIALAIPLCLLWSVAVLYAMGRTLNVLSLMGLMLSVGMVVDNAIVVVEAIQRRRDLGEEAGAAAWRGVGDVALAILVSTLTTVVVLLPLLLMSGSETLGFYLSQIGVPVCVALLLSLLVSLVFLPAATAVVGAWRPRPLAPWLARLTELYAGSLRVVLRRPVDTILVGLILLASVAYPLKHVVETDTSQGGFTDIRFWLDFDPALTWEEMEALVLEDEAVLLEKAEEWGIADLLVRVGGRGQRAQLRAFLVAPAERPISRDRLLEEARRLLPERAGVQRALSWEMAESQRNVNTVRLEGPDSERLMEMAEEVSRRLREIPGVVSVRAEGGERAAAEAWIGLAEAQGLRHGWSPLIVGSAIDFDLRGRQVGRMRLGERDVSVRVEGEVAAHEEGIERLRALELPSLSGLSLPLGAVVDWQRRAGYGAISREDRRTALTLTLTASTDDADALSQAIDQATQDFAFPQGYRLQKTGRFNLLAEGQQDRRFALVMAIVFVFLLMGILFESFVLPLAILVSVPFAFIGVYWFLLATGTSFDMMAGVGLILLVGIVVNNGIVLIDRVRQREDEGYPVEEALVLAGQERLRPILMTAMTTVFGLLPMALGGSHVVGMPYDPLARAVIGGLVSSTLVTLLWVPVVYLILHRWRAAAGG